MRRGLIRLMRHDRGATAIEYGLIIAMIVVAIIVGISSLGGATGGMWGNMSGKIGNALPVA
jgi:pilus assembly protein Flp/PilA